tara:strand:- start:2327 stop:3793 length:1467 start_codon:yes stop_codon:yes gene_type:complete
MYSIAIPSYKRSDIIENKVLKLLAKHSINKSKIFIFVEESEIETYKLVLPEYQIVKGAKGIGKQREAISDYFPTNEFIVSIDDDVCDILDHGKSLINLDIFIMDTFNLLLDNQLTLAGVYPVNNEFFCKNTITCDNRFLIGQLKMFINKKQIERRHYELLEDYENTLKHYIYSSGVIRYNYITLKANYNSGKGGLKEYRTLERKLEEVKKFVIEYPDYAKSKKDGMEIALIKNPKREIIKSLWIGLHLNNISELCINSWLRLNHEVHLYIDGLNLPKYMKRYLESGQLKFFKASDIMKYKKGSEILPFSDLFRYKLLHKLGGTWCDTDMFLLRRLPKDKIIISSENTFQSGAFKSALPYVPNIGVLTFPVGDQFLENLIFKIENSKKKIEFCDNMIVFRKLLKKHEYFDLVSDPLDYCPLPWWSSKESYYDNKYKEKYSVETPSNDLMIENAIGIHLWNNFTFNKHAIDFNKIHTESLYQKLYDLIYS